MFEFWDRKVAFLLTVSQCSMQAEHNHDGGLGVTQEAVDAIPASLLERTVIATCLSLPTLIALL